MRNKRSGYKENMNVVRFNSQVETWVKRELELLRIDQDCELWEIVNDLLKAGLKAKKGETL